MEAFDQLYFFSKVIGSDTLWSPLPPSEVLCKCKPDLHQRLAVQFSAELSIYRCG